MIHLENGQVQLEFENGESRIFAAVVGADGIHSKVRKHIIDGGEPIFRGYNIWCGIVKTNFDIGYGSETYGKGKRVGIVPIKEGVYGWWATCNENYMLRRQARRNKRKVKPFIWRLASSFPDLINNTEHILKNSLVDSKPHKGWTKGNATLIGDTAHPTTPNLGQGGCMAIEGAYILAESVQKYGITPKAFDRYEELHFAHSANIIKESLKLGKIGQLTNPFLIQLRNFAFKVMPSSVALKMIDKNF